MIKNRKFSIIGGDERQIFVAKSMLDDKNIVKVYGYSKEKIEEGINFEDKIENALNETEFVILPVPFTRDSETLNAPFFDSEIVLNENFFKLLENKTVFLGSAKMLKCKNLNFIDYSIREDFSIANAPATAEGAIKIGIEELDKTINSSRCLVVGFGRIGKVLSKLLKDMGAEVSISARSECDLAWINALGYKAENTNNLPKTLDYDLIFNTVPSLIFGKENLLKLDKNTKIIDLASAPGGVDFNLAEFLGIRAVLALGLPGKFSPRTSGEIIKNTIYNVIKEEKL